VSDAFWANLPVLLTSLGAFLTSFAGVWISLRNATKIAAVHRETNSMKDALVKVTGESEYARGKLDAETNRS
jgi:hypothetical protein